MEVLLGGISSILYGVADFLGGQGSRRVPASAFVLWSGVLGFPLMLIAAMAVGGVAVPADYAYGGLAGVLGAFGLVFLFAGLGRGHSAAVAPVAAAVGAVIPILLGVLWGERPSPIAWIGIGVALPAIILCAWVTEPGDVPLGGLVYGLAAGVGFGGFAVVIRQTTAESNLLPLIASRGATMLAVLALGLFGVWRLVRFSKVPRGLVVSNAVLDTSANVTFLLAIRSGSLALAAVAASFYPAVTVLLSRRVNQEHVSTHQVVGLVSSVLAIAAIAAG